MKRHLSRFNPMRLVFASVVACTLLLSCGLTAFAAEANSPDLAQTTVPTATSAPTVTAAAPLPPYPKDMKDELFPADVQTIIEDGTRKIVKTYILTAEQSHTDIPRDSFERDGWLYTLTDITENRSSGMDVKDHNETVTINTETKDLNEIIKQLSPTLEYQSEDGYCGLLALDLASVKCEAAGYKNSSYTVSATREYPHLSANDLSLIPKTITENGRTLELADVTWEVQNYVNVDYQDIPDSYRAVATFTANASKSIVTGYITTAEYSGEVVKMVEGDAVYTVYFSGTEIAPSPKSTETPKPTETPEPTPTETPISDKENGSVPVVPLIICFAVIAALMGGCAVYFFLRHNVKVYIIGESERTLAAKVRISEKNLVIDLTPLDNRAESRCFELEIDRLTAKSLNGRAIEVIYGPAKLQHKIAYEGNTYKINADYRDMTIKAIY